MVALNEVCELITDGSHFSPKDIGEGYPMLSVKDMGERDFSFSSCKHISKADYDILVKNGCKPQKGDVLVAKDGSYFKYAFQICEDREIVILSSIAILRPKADVLDAGYLREFLMADSTYSLVSLNYISGTALKRVILQGIKKIQIPLPPLEEQRRIAALLDKVSGLIAKRRAQLDKLDLMVKARFVEMFGDINLNDRGWNVQPLGELCKIVRGGSPRPIEKFLGGDVPWIKIGDATAGENIYLHSTREHIIQEGVSKSRLVKAGSLIFANCGVSLGFARIITFDGCIHDGWLAFEDIDSRLDKVFLLQTLNQMTEEFRKIAPSGTQPNLNTAIMKAYQQIIPPLQLQKDLIAFVEQIDKSKLTIQQSLDKLETLKKALMQQYFG